MRILFITSQAQLDGFGGGVTHTSSMLSLFAALKGVEVERLVLPLPWNSMPRAIRRVRALAMAEFNSVPSKTNFLCPRGARKILKRALATQKFDAVAFNGSDLLPLRDAVPPEVKRILVSHNVEADIITGQLAKMRLPHWLRKIANRDVRRTCAMEEAGVRAMSLVITISTDDAAQYARLAPSVPVLSISGAFAAKPFAGQRLEPDLPLQLACIGKMSWWPNREGANWLIKEVLSKIPIGRVAMRFYGPGTEGPEFSTAASEGCGIVPDLGQVWRSAHFTLCPVREGSGVNVKLIESLYNGVPVLTTPHGCRGLPPIDDAALAVVKPEEWASFLSSDAALRLAGSDVLPETRALFSQRSQLDRLTRALMSLGAL